MTRPCRLLRAGLELRSQPLLRQRPRLTHRPRRPQRHLDHRRQRHPRRTRQASAIGFIAFDVEPNIGAGWGSRRVTFDNNQIGAYYLYAYAIVQNAPISDQAFTNNTVSGRGLRIGITNPFTRTFRPANVTISGNRAASPQRAPALEILNVDGLTVTANTIPLSGGRMATIDNTCNATVSGNSYPGGILEALITRPRSDCGRRGRARRVRRSAHAAPATAARAALTIQASSPSPRP